MNYFNIDVKIILIPCNEIGVIFRLTDFTGPYYLKYHATIYYKLVFNFQPHSIRDPHLTEGPNFRLQPQTRGNWCFPSSSDLTGQLSTAYRVHRVKLRAVAYP